MYLGTLCILFNISVFAVNSSADLTSILKNACIIIQSQGISGVNQECQNQENWKNDAYALKISETLKYKSKEFSQEKSFLPLQSAPHK